MPVQHFFDKRTWTLTYVVWDETTGDAVVIDPVLDFDPLKVSVYEESLKRLLDFVDTNGLNLRYALETHVHADHFSGAFRLREQRKVPVAIGNRIREVQQCFANLFGYKDFPVDGRQFDRLVEDGEVIEAGSLRATALHTPGHTPACVAWHIGDALFTGDALFMPDFGTGRCDFPGGNASTLYDAIHRLYRLPPSTKIHPGHDYQPGGRPLQWESTIEESRTSNVHLKANTSREQYVSFRTSRDATLSPPPFFSPRCKSTSGPALCPNPTRMVPSAFAFRWVFTRGVTIPDGHSTSAKGINSFSVVSVRVSVHTFTPEA